VGKDAGRTGSSVHARQAAQRYHFESVATDIGEALSDPATDIVFISTPNNLHAEMAIRCARAGKAVFVEKPLCINPAELEELIEVQKETGARIVVGFNRRYAPLILKLKELLSKLDGPILVNYRANTDFIINSSGGTGVSISILDDFGNTIASGLTTLAAFRISQGMHINFGAFSGTPSTTVFGI
jgi:predicted dehydrogenase